MTPLHTDKRRFSIFDPLLLVVAGMLLVQGLASGNPLPIMTAVGVGAFILFTRHSGYDLFQDVLLIRFRAPRKIVVQLSEIQDVRLMSLPFASRALVIHRRNGKHLVITPKDAEGFLSLLQDSLGTEPVRAAPEARLDAGQDAPETGPDTGPDAGQDAGEAPASLDAADGASAPERKTYQPRPTPRRPRPRRRR